MRPHEPNMFFFFFYVKSVDHPERREKKKMTRRRSAEKRAQSIKDSLNGTWSLIKYFESCICVPPERAVLESAL